MLVEVESFLLVLVLLDVDVLTLLLLLVLVDVELDSIVELFTLLLLNVCSPH